MLRENKPYCQIQEQKIPERISQKKLYPIDFAWKIFFIQTK